MTSNELCRTVCPKARVLLIPHTVTGGGAGIYISHLVRALETSCRLALTGPFRSFYSKSGIHHNDPLDLPLGFFPNYRGVSVRAKLYWLSRMVVDFALSASRFARIRRELAHYDCVVATSSIQLPLLWLMQLAGYQGRTICIIQENLQFTGLFGMLMAILLRRVDRTVSISKSWSRLAYTVGVTPVYLPNQFERSNGPDQDIHFDAAYVGGDSRLKGFHNVLELFRVLSKTRKVRIALLGHYGKRARVQIDQLNRECNQNGSYLEVFGVVDDVYHYIQSSIVVLLPIEESHFCRPAVEAGFCKKTFIINELDGIEDFAELGINCFSYRGDVDGDFLRVFMFAIENEKVRTERELQNYISSLRNFFSDNWNDVASTVLGLGHE